MPDINMQVFEEAQRNQLVTEVDIQTQVTLDDYQVQLSNIANPTQSQDNVVIDRNGEFLQHWNESLDFDTWVKVSMGIAGKRLLMLRGNSSASSVSSINSVFPTNDDFEDASQGDWTTVAGAPDYDNTDYGYHSAQSLKLDIDGGYDRCTLPVTASDTISIQQRVYKTDAGQIHIAHKDVGDDKAVALIFNVDGTIQYYDTSWHSLGSFPEDEWILIELNNFDWTAHTYNIEINGIIEASNVDMFSTTAWDADKLQYTVEEGISYIDNVIVRKYTASEPIHNIGTLKNISTALKLLGRAG